MTINAPPPGGLHFPRRGRDQKGRFVRMKLKKLGKLLDSGLDHLAVRIAQTAQRQGVPVWSMYVGRTDCPQKKKFVCGFWGSGGRFAECSETTTFIKGAHKWTP